MSRDLFAMWMLANVGALAFFCFTRYVIYYRPRGRVELRRHGRRRPMLDKWLGIK